MAICTRSPTGQIFLHSGQVLCFMQTYTVWGASCLWILSCQTTLLWWAAVLSVFSVQRSAAWMPPTHASITNIITTTGSRRSWQTIHSFWLLAAGFVAIGLIASALQIQRTKRVIAYDAVPFSSPLTVYSAACTVNNDSYSSEQNTRDVLGCH